MKANDKKTRALSKKDNEFYPFSTLKAGLETHLILCMSEWFKYNRKR